MKKAIALLLSLLFVSGLTFAKGEKKKMKAPALDPNDSYSYYEWEEYPFEIIEIEEVDENGKFRYKGLESGSLLVNGGFKVLKTRSGIKKYQKKSFLL